MALPLRHSSHCRLDHQILHMWGKTVRVRSLARHTGEFVAVVVELVELYHLRVVVEMGVPCSMGRRLEHLTKGMVPRKREETVGVDFGRMVCLVVELLRPTHNLFVECLGCIVLVFLVDRFLDFLGRTGREFLVDSFLEFQVHTGLDFLAGNFPGFLVYLVCYFLVCFVQAFPVDSFLEFQVHAGLEFLAGNFPVFLVCFVLVVNFLGFLECTGRGFPGRMFLVNLVDSFPDFPVRIVPVNLAGSYLDFLEYIDLAYLVCTGLNL